MHLFLILLALFFLSGCIEPYHPDQEELKTGTVVVVAHLNNRPGRQSIQLSRSSTLVYPEFDALTGCNVEIVTEDGDTRTLEESEPGNYGFNFKEEFFRNAVGYCLRFCTPDGEQYESEFEIIHPGPEIDALYYQKETSATIDPDHVVDGVQFYIDFEIDKDSGRYLRWQLLETYEIHNPEYPVLIFDLDRRMKDLPDSSSWRNCWITLEIPEIYTLDLGNVEGKYYRRMHLNYVSNQTRRLHYRYSLLVRQLALSEGAFWYWNELGKNLQSKGNLFDIQPSVTPGNICNVNDEEEMIVGYFSLSGASEKRIFVENVPDLDLYINPYYCMPGQYPRFLSWYPDKDLPVYIATDYVDGERKTGEIQKKCADCREYKGSSHIKPDFW